MLPAGDYWIGDPCYVLGDVNGYVWDEVLDATRMFGFGLSQNVNVFSVGSCLLGASFTANGDGVYSDQQGYKYGVDAGLIAAVPLKMLPEKFDGQVLGRIVTFSAPFAVRYTNGAISFGDIVINTV